MQFEGIKHEGPNEDKLLQYLREHYQVIIEESTPDIPFSDMVSHAGFEALPEKKKMLIDLTAAACRVLYGGVLMRDKFGKDHLARRAMETAISTTQYKNVFEKLYGRSKLRKRRLMPVHTGILRLALALGASQTPEALEVTRIKESLPTDAEMHAYDEASDEEKIQIMRRVNAAAEQFLSLVSPIQEQKKAA
jgi:hypothetical protein